MPRELLQSARFSDDIYQDLQKIIRVGLYRFRADQLVGLPQAAGYLDVAEDRVVCSAIRALIREQISFLPDEEWRDFAERLFGLTDDTSNQPTSVREQLAGEGLKKPLQPSSVRAKGGMREAIVLMLTEQIGDWSKQHLRRSSGIQVRSPIDEIE